MVPGALLAAGRSSRMGRPKALLPCGAGETFVAKIIAAMQAGGIGDVLVVGRPDDADLRDAVAHVLGQVRYIENPDHDRGQLTSIVAAVNAIDRPGVRGLLVIPVDMPLVRPDTFAAVLRGATDHPGKIVRATYAGRHGHPVLFDRGSFDALRHADPAIGAKAVLHGDASRVVDVDVSDAGVLTDIDSMKDYIEAFGHPPDDPRWAVPS